MTTLSKEHKEKIGASVKIAMSNPDVRKRISDKLTGRKLSEDTKRKLGDLHRGKPKSEQHRKKLSVAKRLENHPRWLGGKSFEPYCPKFNREFKERVRSFFGYKCVECGINPKYSLSVHHVNFDKMSCCNGAKPLFVILCKRCHARTNIDREYWEQHFTEIIDSRYGGNCWK